MLYIKYIKWGARQTTANYDEVQPNSLSTLSELPNRDRSQSEASSIISHDKTASIERKLTEIVDPDRKLSAVKVVLDDTFDFITVSTLFSLFSYA
uniref:Uncharacterized protein n=1 Tax=Syphacia muris TaxID=451379 RepID=A0A0N5AC17_9BILA